jgi:hypothetical protein
MFMSQGAQTVIRSHSSLSGRHLHLLSCGAMRRKSKAEPAEHWDGLLLIAIAIKPLDLYVDSMDSRSENPAATINM